MRPCVATREGHQAPAPGPAARKRLGTGLSFVVETSSGSLRLVRRTYFRSRISRSRDRITSENVWRQSARECWPARRLNAFRESRSVQFRLSSIGSSSSRASNGVDYYNDSKATNVDATMKGVGVRSRPRSHHPLGGKDKGSDYSVLNDLLRQRAKRCTPLVPRPGR